MIVIHIELILIIICLFVVFLAIHEQMKINKEVSELISRLRNKLDDYEQINTAYANMTTNIKYGRSDLSDHQKKLFNLLKNELNTGHIGAISNDNDSPDIPKIPKLKYIKRENNE